mgnify:CR=1 FL=1
MYDLVVCISRHADPGAFGYYPLVDRKNQYYMQIVADEDGKFYPRSGIPEYLRLLVKPLVDGIMNGMYPESLAHHTPGMSCILLLHRLAAFVKFRILVLCSPQRSLTGRH